MIEGPEQQIDARSRNANMSLVGTKPTCHPGQRMSADKGVTDYVRTSRIDADNPKATSVSANRSVGGE
jgi:hypothetical protein